MEGDFNKLFNVSWDDKWHLNVLVVWDLTVDLLWDFQKTLLNDRARQFNGSLDNIWLGNWDNPGRIGNRNLDRDLNEFDSLGDFNDLFLHSRRVTRNFNLSHDVFGNRDDFLDNYLLGNLNELVLVLDLWNLDNSFLHLSPGDYDFALLQNWSSDELFGDLVPNVVRQRDWTQARHHVRLACFNKLLGLLREGRLDRRHGPHVRLI